MQALFFALGFVGCAFDYRANALNSPPQELDAFALNTAQGCRFVTRSVTNGIPTQSMGTMTSVFVAIAIFS
ncbi:hypothetical protein CCL17_18600 [Pseudomonas congelans]|nr:hypothetical protein CCL17_18600 [Pseudomonas congelans]